MSPVQTSDPFFSRHDVVYDLITGRLAMIRAIHATAFCDEFSDKVWAYEIDNGSTRFEWELLTIDEGRFGLH